VALILFSSCLIRSVNIWVSCCFDASLLLVNSFVNSSAVQLVLYFTVMNVPTRLMMASAPSPRISLSPL